MATTYKTLHQSLLSTTTETTTYTAPPGTAAIISTITFVNVSPTASSTIKVWQVPTALTATGDAYTMLPPITLAPGERYVMSGPKTIAAGVTFKVQASVASAMNVLIEGAEVGGVDPDAWGQAGARVIATGATNIPNTGTFTPVSFGGESFDIDGMHSTSVNPDRLVCTVAGLYVVSANVAFQSTDVAGYRSVQLWKNGVSATPIAVNSVDAGDSGALWHRLNVTTTIDLLPGDYLQVAAAQNSGTNPIPTDANAMTNFSAVRVGYQTNPSEPLAAKIYPSANFATPSAGVTWVGLNGAATLNTVMFDYNAGAAQANTTSGALTCQRNGLYQITAELGIVGSLTGQTGLTILKNGAINPRNAGHTHWVESSGVFYRTTTALVPLVVGDAVSIGFYNPTAGAKTVDANWTSLSMHYVRAT